LKQIFSTADVWDMSSLPSPYSGLYPRTADSEKFSTPLLRQFRDNKSLFFHLNAYVVQAVLADAEKLPLEDFGISDISVMKVSQQEIGTIWYVSEMDMKDGTVYILSYSVNTSTGESN